MYKLKTLIMCIVAVGLSSCNVLDQEPQQSLPADGGLETLADFESALIGTYNSVQEFSNGDNAAQLLFLNDIIAEDALWVGSFPTYSQVRDQQMEANNSSIAGQWNGAYEAINNANILLDNLENLEADQAAKDNIRGQALFIRALEYYYLVQYFALPWNATADNSHLGVPLQLSSVTSQADFQQPSRSTVAEVYDQILDDLEAAEGLITNTSPNQATNDAVIGLQARIALIQQRWDDAAALAGEVIDVNALSDDVTEFFRNELSDESIFEIQNTTQDTPDPANTAITAVYHPQTRGDIEVSENYLTVIEDIITEEQQAELEAANLTAIDNRDSLLLLNVGGTIYSHKYEDNINAADNVPVMRMSEMILTRAEALVESAASLADVPQEAFDLLNAIRTRAINVVDENGVLGDATLIEYEASDFADKQELIDAILLERRVELAFEGHRKTDLQRRQMDVKGTPWDADILVFPIPQSQIDANPNLEDQQNEAYN